MYIYFLCSFFQSEAYIYVIFVAVNEALKQEIERLREISNTWDSFISGVHHMCRSPTTAGLFTQQAGTLPHYSTQATMRNANQTCSFSNIMQEDLFGWFQRLEPMKFCWRLVGEMYNFYMSISIRLEFFKIRWFFILFYVMV